MPRDRDLEAMLAAVALGECSPAILADFLEERGDDRAAAVRACGYWDLALALFRQWSWKLKWVPVPDGGKKMTLRGAFVNFGRVKMLAAGVVGGLGGWTHLDIPAVR